jgi:predicted ATP-grasp superfamily ATP-dependent carboligase
MTGINRMCFTPTVLVYEFFTGGGCPSEELPDGLAVEALGMLCALLMDFRRWGAVRTITALDSRFDEKIPGLTRNTLPADKVFFARQGEHEEIYLSLLKRCDAVLVIAPETNGILSKLAALAEIAGTPLLGCSASAAAAAGDKAECGRILDLANLPIPETRIADFNSALQVVRDMDFPLVVKPIDGVGSEGVFQINELCDLPSILANVRRSTSHEQILLQSFAGGIPASVSLLVANGRCLPLSLNRQLMEGNTPFHYAGSQVPFFHHAAGYAMELASDAAKQITGLKGYVGVDLILSDEKARLIEINPRLTTSYIGLRQVAQVNLAQTIWEACMNGILPDRVSLTGQVIITKDDPGSWNLKLVT